MQFIKVVSEGLAGEYGTNEDFSIKLRHVQLLLSYHLQKYWQLLIRLSFITRRCSRYCWLFWEQLHTRKIQQKTQEQISSYSVSRRHGAAVVLRHGITDITVITDITDIMIIIVIVFIMKLYWLYPLYLLYRL